MTPLFRSIKMLSAEVIGLILPRVPYYRTNPKKMQLFFLGFFLSLVNVDCVSTVEISMVTIKTHILAFRFT